MVFFIEEAKRMRKTKILYFPGKERILNGSKPPPSGTFTPQEEYRPPPDEEGRPDSKPKT